MNISQIDVRKIIAERLQIARKNAGYASAEIFCEKYDLPKEHYGKHENGTLSMTASEIIAYCLVLDVSVCYLMLGEEPEELRKQPEKK